MPERKRQPQLPEGRGCKGGCCRGQKERKVFILLSLGCKRSYQPQKHEMFQVLFPREKEPVVKDSNMCPFCMRHIAGVGCYGKGTETKPACPIPECDGNDTKEFHEIMMRSLPLVNTLECEEDNDERMFKHDDGRGEMLEDGVPWIAPGWIFK